MMIKMIVTTLSFVVLGAAAIPRAQLQSSETARKHLESGMQFYKQGRYKQALSDFEIVVSMADGNYADDALLKIGEYYLEIEENFAKASEYFDKILQLYPTKDGAPGAYYYLGLVTLRSGASEQSLDDAMANFQRVVRLYPQSSWVPAALAATGTALERKAAWEDAVDAYFQVVAEYPESAWAAGAQVALGRCMVRLGDPKQGMVEIQRARERYPDMGEAEEALDLLTHLFRLYGYPALGRPVSFRVDRSFRPGLADKFKNVRAVKISPTGIHVLERGRKRVLTFETSGKLATTTAAANPQALFVDAKGGMVVANEKGLLIEQKPLVLNVPEDKGPRPLDKIKAAVRDRLGDIYVYDEKRKRILRFHSGGQLVASSFPDATPREILRMELDNNGNIIFLEKAKRSIVVYNPAGRRLARIERKGGNWALEKPTDFAVDPAGYFYVLDEEQPQIAVFDPSYQFVAMLTGESLGGGVLKKPVALDVDGSGDIYVYDDGAKTLLRFH